MGALEEEVVTGLNHQVSRKLGTLEDQMQGLGKGGGKAIEGYEFGKPVPEIKRVRWQNAEYKHASSDDEDMPQDIGKRAGMPDSEIEYETADNLPCSQIQAKGNVNLLLSLSKVNSFVGQISPRSSPRDTQEIGDLGEKVKLLEAALKAKSMDIESLRQSSNEKETDLLDKIECLELANEQLLQGGSDAGTEQLQMELTRLQKQNALLAQRERELQFQLSTKDMLQEEVSHLQELNQQLMDDRVQSTVDPDEPVGKLAEKISFLETELAEAIEVNNMYKSELQFAFSKQENVRAAALQNFGNVDDIIDELLQLRQQTKTQEAELQDLRDRFFLISIHLAETEASREELQMKVKRFQNLLRH